MQGISRLFIFLLLSINLAVAQSVVPYRLLASHVAGSEDSIKESDYNISVEQYLDVSGIKDIICRLIRTEKPRGYDVLSAGIYYKLDRYDIETEAAVADAAEHRERRIAQYHWNKDSPKDARRLVVTRDSKGQSLQDWRFYDFDHMKACK